MGQGRERITHRESAVSDRVSQEAGVKKGVGFLTRRNPMLVDVTKNIEDSSVKKGV